LFLNNIIKKNASAFAFEKIRPSTKQQQLGCLIGVSRSVALSRGRLSSRCRVESADDPPCVCTAHYQSLYYIYLYTTVLRSLAGQQEKKRKHGRTCRKVYPQAQTVSSNSSTVLADCNDCLCCRLSAFFTVLLYVPYYSSYCNKVFIEPNFDCVCRSPVVEVRIFEFGWRLESPQPLVSRVVRRFALRVVEIVLLSVRL